MSVALSKMHPFETEPCVPQGNLVYLAMITNRVPVIPPFTSSGHIGFAQPIPFGDIFDVPRLREAIGPVIEWRDLKDPASEEIEDIGCWNIWEAVQDEHKNPRHSHVPTWLNLGKLSPLPSHSPAHQQRRHLLHARTRLGETPSGDKERPAQHVLVARIARLPGNARGKSGQHPPLADPFG
jgi:hypothetical protein